MNKKLQKTNFFCLLLLLMFVSGCAVPVVKEFRICSGVESISQIAGLLESQGENSVSFKANGNCVWRQRKDGVLKRQEVFNVKIWVSPPGEIRLQGDIAFDPQGIVLGSNSDEYWLAIKPGGISSYWWGQWANAESFGGLAISPKVLLEAMGVVEADFGQGWSLANEGPFDVLTKVSGGVAVKKVYVYSCERRVARIEYFNDSGERIVAVELGNYIKVTDDFYVPGIVKLVSDIGDEGENSFLITLSSVRESEFSDVQRGRLFAKPKLEGFSRVVENGVLVKSPD
ncbi:MAG: hypothetical protein FVQ80_10340 [Planctomycetes bacterium]|nr:hypothetical protein [Planctomycetota bacterium]